MRIKFLTLNVWNGGKLRTNILEFIKKENPNILTLQEVRGNENDWLTNKIKEFGYNHSIFGARLKYLKEGESGNCTFSKYPLIAFKNIFFDVPYGTYDRAATEKFNDFSQLPRNMLYTQINANGIKLNVFNIHGIWGFDGEDNERRLKMSKIIIDEIKDKENIILAGDFNMNRNTKSIRDIEKYLVSVFKDELATSFNMRHKPVGSGYATAAVDMIFISPNIKVLGHQCPQVDVSDHLPLVAVLEI